MSARPFRKALRRRALARRAVTTACAAIAALFAAGCLIRQPIDREAQEAAELKRRSTAIRELDVSITAAKGTVKRAFANLGIELVAIKDEDSRSSLVGSSERRRVEVKVELETRGEYATHMEVTVRKWKAEDDQAEGTIRAAPQGSTAVVVVAGVRQKVIFWDKEYAIEIADEISGLLESGGSTASGLP